MQEITATERTYYFIKKPNNVQLIEGVLDPKPGRKQVVATQDENTIFSGPRRLDVLAEIEATIGPQVAFNDLLTKDEVNGGYTWGRDGEEDDTFLVFARPSVAEPLSRALYEVVNPGQTGMYARVYHHPDPTQYCVMEFRQEDIVPIALGADPTPIQDALAITVTDGALTQQEADDIVNAVTTYAGQEVNLVDFIPASWADQRVDLETAILLGYNLE